MFVAGGALFVLNVIPPLFAGPRVSKRLDGAASGSFTNGGEAEKPSILDRIELWIVVAVALVVVAYSLPLSEILARSLFPVLCAIPGGARPFG